MIGKGAAAASTTLMLELLGKRMASNRAWSVYAHADQQLRRTLEELGGPHLPTSGGLHWLAIGLMAAREPESTDPKFATALQECGLRFQTRDLSVMAALRSGAAH